QFTRKLMTKSKLPTIETLKSSIVLAELERMSTIIQAITDKGSDFKVDETFELFAQKFSEFSKEDILKIFFSLNFNQKLKRFNQLGSIDCEKNSNFSASFSSNGSVRLFMNMGKDDGLNLKMLLDDVSKEFRIPRGQIQKVEMKNRFSFFEVPSNFGETFVNNKNLVIRKRKINFEISQPRK
ncbi:MAG: DbpA RNA binding domain-containing protein, partial [Bacteriovoracales bacterium]